MKEIGKFCLWTFFVVTAGRGQGLFGWCHQGLRKKFELHFTCFV